MDPQRYRLPSRYGKSHDLGLLSIFLLTILLMVSVVAVLTAGTAWTVPDLPRIQPLQPRASGLFGAGVIDRPPAATPAPAVADQPTATATAVPATPTQAPTPSPTPEAVRAYIVGNTDGVGVWLRRTPRVNDYLLSWADGTRMEVVGPDVQAEGRLWRHVRDPRGNVGYIPAEWLIPAP